MRMLDGAMPSTYHRGTCYPWPQIAEDGRVAELRRHEDYEPVATYVVKTARRWAQRHGWRCVARVEANGERLLIQFSAKSDAIS